MLATCMETDTPAVSVIMAVYNGQRYLAEAIDSILAQTFTDFEFIIIDDGSSDQSGRILSDYAAKDPRIRPFTRPNRGLTCSLNEAIRLSRGHYIARMDADDVALPNRFELQVKYLDENPCCVAVGAANLIIDPDGMPIYECHGPLTHCQIDNQHLYHGGGGLSHPVVMMRHDALIKIGGYCERFRTAQDLDLFLRLGEIGQLANLPDVLLKYREHPGQVGITRYKQQKENAQTILCEAHVRRGLPLPDEIRLPAAPPFNEIESRKYWAKEAIRGGYMTTARKHAWIILRRRPLSPDSWFIALAALTGRSGHKPRKFIRSLRNLFLGT